MPVLIGVKKQCSQVFAADNPLQLWAFSLVSQPGDGAACPGAGCPLEVKNIGDNLELVNTCR